MRGMPGFCISCLVCISAYAGPWYYSYSSLRIPITISAGDVDRPEYAAVEVPFDAAAILGKHAPLVKMKRQYMRLIEVDSAGNILDSMIVCQYNPPFGGSLGPTLTVILAHGMKAESSRRYLLYMSKIRPLCTGIGKPVDAWGFNPRTMNGRYDFIPAGAGFSSIRDKSRKDWVSYNAANGPAGNWRCLPCLALEKFGHPGIPQPIQGLQITSTVFAGNAKAMYRSSDKDSLWETIWHVYPTYATMEVVKAAGPYWFVYEGTPGGQFDTTHDYILLPNGSKRYFTKTWVEDIASADSRTEWMAITGDSLTRSFLMLNHADDTLPDFGRQMYPMAVAGFGRGGAEQNWYHTPYLQGTGKKFSIAFVESRDTGKIREFVRTIIEPARATVGKPELRPASLAKSNPPGVNALTVVVKSGKDHPYGGMGFNALKLDTLDCTPQVREAVWKKFFVEAKFNTMRLFASPDNVKWFIDNNILSDAAKHGVSTILVAGLGSASSRVHADTSAFALKKLHDAGVPINVMGLWNKPNTNGSGTRYRTPETVVTDIKLLHEKMVALGIQDYFKLIAPETVEWWPLAALEQQEKYDYHKGDDENYIRAIMADSEALASLSCFAIQSYGKGMTRELRDLVRPTGKEIWTTLSATDAVDHDSDYIDPVIGPVRCAIMLSDLNLGASRCISWTWQQMIALGYLKGCSPDSLPLEPTYHFLANLSSALDSGAWLRQCISDPPRPSPEMDFNYSREPDIVAASAQNPDGSWTIALLNLTGVHAQHYASYFDPEEGRPYHVTVRIEELATQSKVPFSVRRTRAVADRIAKDPEITMSKGTLKIEVQPLELAVLRSLPQGK